MADQASIFQASGTPDPTLPAPGSGNTPNPDEVATLLLGIKNESGQPKYRTVQDALKALQHSQEYIPTLKQTKDELEARLVAAESKAAKVEALELAVQELTQKQTAGSTTPTGLTEEQIAELVNRTLTKTQQAEQQKQNLDSLVADLKTTFGDKAESTFYGKATELGMTVAEFNTLAATKPKAVRTLLGLNGTTETRTTNSPGINTDGFQKKPESAITSNRVKSVLMGASTNELQAERQRAKDFVTELHDQGRSVHELTDPKVYFKHFG